MASVTHSTTLNPRKNSFLDRLTPGEKLWLAISIIALFSGAFPITIIIALVIYNRVNKREQTKLRIANLLSQVPETSTIYVASQIGQSQSYVTQILKLMILDEGAPIRFNLVTGEIKCVGPIYGIRTFNPSSTPKTQSVEVPVQYNSSVPSQPVVEPTQEIMVQPSTTAPRSGCIQCGEKLPVKARYCHECGVRQF